MPVLAVGAVDLVALFIALAVLLVLLAGWVVGELLRKAFAVLAKPQGIIGTILSPATAVFGFIADHLVAAMEAAISFDVRFMDRAVHGFAHLVWMLATGVWHLLDGLIHAIADAKTWAVRAYNQATAGVMEAENYAAGLVSQAEAAAASEVAGAVSYANAVAATLEGEIATVASDVVSEANTVLGEAESYAVAQADTVMSAASALFGQAEADLTAAADAVESEAVRLFGQAEADIASGVAAAEAGLAGLTGVVQGLEGQIAGITGALGALAVLPGLLSSVSALTAEADTCLKPLCDTVTPNAGSLGRLGGLLTNLEALGIDVLVAGLFAAAVTDPAGLARETVTVVEAVGDPVVTGVRDLVGL